MEYTRGYLADLVEEMFTNFRTALYSVNNISFAVPIPHTKVKYNTTLTCCSTMVVKVVSWKRRHFRRQNTFSHFITGLYTDAGLIYIRCNIITQAKKVVWLWK